MFNRICHTGLLAGYLALLCLSCASSNRDGKKQWNQDETELLNELVIAAYSGPPAGEQDPGGQWELEPGGSVMLELKNDNK